MSPPCWLGREPPVPPRMRPRAPAPVPPGGRNRGGSPARPRTGAGDRRSAGRSAPGRCPRPGAGRRRGRRDGRCGPAARRCVDRPPRALPRSRRRGDPAPDGVTGDPAGTVDRGPSRKSMRSWRAPCAPRTRRRSPSTTKNPASGASNASTASRSTISAMAGRSSRAESAWPTATSRSSRRPSRTASRPSIVSTGATARTVWLTGSLPHRAQETGNGRPIAGRPYVAALQVYCSIAPAAP